MSDLRRIAGAHNWLRRGVMGARASIYKAQFAETLTDEARALAAKIDCDLARLVNLLEKRKDQV